MSERPTFDAFRNEALSDPRVRTEYEALEDDYQLKRRLIAMRKTAGLTQEQMAEKLGTKKSSISRLESFNSTNSPTLARIEDYARVLGYATRVDFEPIRAGSSQTS